jgi:hypothetical protein
MNDPLSFWPTAYGWEILLLIMSTTGFISSVWGVISAWNDRRILKQSGVNGERGYLAFQKLFEEISRFVALGTLTYGGVFAVSTAPPAAPQTIFVLNVVAFILNLKALQDNRYRRMLRTGYWKGGRR